MLHASESVVGLVVAVGIGLGIVGFTVSTLLAGSGRVEARLAARLAAKPRAQRIVSFAEEVCSV